MFDAARNYDNVSIEIHAPHFASPVAGFHCGSDRSEVALRFGDAAAPALAVVLWQIDELAVSRALGVDAAEVRAEFARWVERSGALTLVQLRDPARIGELELALRPLWPDSATVIRAFESRKVAMPA